MNKKVLHVIPDSVIDPQMLYLGSTKDIRTRTEYFRQRNVRYDELVADKRSDALLLEKIQKMDLRDYQFIVFEYPIYPKSMAYLRKKYPQLVLIARSHNAELYHRIHYFLAFVRSRQVSLVQSIWENRVWLKIALQSFLTDFMSAWYAHYVLAICEWEKKYYWNLMKNPRRVKVVPYYLSSQYYQELAVEQKKYQCVCLMSPGSKHTPFLMDASNNLSSLVDSLGDNLPHWDFLVTGELSNDEQNPLAKRMSQTGFLESPFPLLSQSRALAILSDFGFGFKTKILDAILAKNYVLVTGGLYKRIPESIKPYSIKVNKKSVPEFINALDQCERSYPPDSPNDTLRAQAFQSLDQIMGVQ